MTKRIDAKWLESHGVHYRFHTQLLSGDLTQLDPHVAFKDGSKICSMQDQKENYKKFISDKWERFINSKALACFASKPTDGVALFNAYRFGVLKYPDVKILSVDSTLPPHIIEEKLKRRNRSNVIVFHNAIENSSDRKLDIVRNNLVRFEHISRILCCAASDPLEFMKEKLAMDADLYLSWRKGLSV